MRTRSSRLAANGLPQIIRAHLFGIDPTYEPPTAAARSVTLTLSGVIATDNPTEGAAILAEQGRPGRLYHAGADLATAEPARLQQVFADRVTVEVRGQVQTIRLSRATAADFRNPPAVLMAVAAEQSDPVASDADSMPSAAQTLLSGLHAELAGGIMAVYPDAPLRHSYGIHPGDVITAVNGVSVGDPNALNAAVAAATGPTSLTIIHNGVPITVDVPEGDPGSN